jgi:outer membrane protein assembly factor BamB
VAKKLLTFCMTALLALLLVALAPSRPTHGYIECNYPLGKVMAESTNILVMVVESVDRQKNIIIYRKVRDLKGTHPGDILKHNIGQAGFNPREWQNVMAWADIGKTAVFFHNGGIGTVCIENYWYQVPLGGDWWNMNHAEPYMLRTFAGKPDKLATAVTAILAGQEAVIPCMVDGDKNAIQLRTARVQRMKASLQIQDYNPQRDFVDWGSGGDEFRAIGSMPGFTHMLSLSRIGAGAAGIAPADINGDGRTDFCLFGASQMCLFQNGGNTFDEARLPAQGGARGAAWGDYDGDGKLDLVLATPSGPRLFRNTGESGKPFEDVTAGLPLQGYQNARAAAWLDYDGDGKLDILLADGFRGLRLFRNRGSKIDKTAPPAVGKWYYAGPFDNTGQRGFDAVYPPEQGVDLKAEYKGKNNEKVVWQEGKFTDGQVNSLALFKPECNSNSAVYVYREYNVGGAMELPIGLGSDDTLTVWLNGQKVLAQNVYRGCTPDEVQLKLALRPGKNTLLMKICQGDGEYSFFFSAKTAIATVPQLFDDVSDAAGLGANGIGGKLKGDHLAVADVNGDGRQDFLYSAGSGLLVLASPKGFVESKDSGISYQTGNVAPAFGDFNGDGKPDLFIPQKGACKLLRNDGAGRFSDVAAASGDLARPVGDARCAAWVEFRKGRADLLVGCWKGPNRFFENDGKGRFTEATDDIGLTGQIFNTSALAVQDLNKDKTPDLVLNNEGQDPVILLSSPAWFAAREKQHVAVAEAAAKAAAATLGTQTVAAGPSLLVIILAAGAVGAILLVLARRRGDRSAASAFLFVSLAIPAANADASDWTSARGNAQRTGSVDDAPGPKAPRVLWVYKSREQYVAPPSPGAKALYLPAVGAMNTGVFHAIALAPDATQRVLWSKAPPYIVRPTVCSPVVADGLVVFGDGMHQTDDAILYCLLADSGIPVWQFPVPGKLIHLEAPPAMDKGRVYFCGGDAGVLCVDAKRVTLDGKEQDLAAVTQTLTKRWAELLAKYEAEKKKDPALAMPPGDDALPKPAPKLLWQQGKNKWHIDAPPVVAGDFVLVASAFLDDEKVGKRSLFCLKAADGSVVWESPVTFNPWAGPTVAGQTVLLGSSSIRFDRKLLAQAQGDVRAIDLATGQTRWTKTVTGGVLSPVAVKGDVAVYACTDGSVVARKHADSQRAWTYQGKAPFFGGPAIAGDVVYVADLNATVHALSLADGKALWTLDLASDPAIQSRAMVYASPVVHGGDLYIVTCNIDGEAGQSSYVVCLSDKQSTAPVAAAPVTVNKTQRSVVVPCRVAPRKLATLKEVYPLEVVATHPSPRGQKAHETVVVSDCKPSDIHKALQAVGLQPGKPVVGDEEVTTGPEVRVLLEVPGFTEKPRLIPLEKLIVDSRTGKTLPALTWHFTGSVMRQPNPDKDERVYGADLSGTLISLLPVTDETVCQAGISMKDGKLLRLDTNKNLLPAEGTEVKLIIEAK